MKLEIEKTATVPADLSSTWGLVSDVPRLIRCIPGITDFETLTPGREYAACLSDRMGPFRLVVPVQIKLQEVDEFQRLAADVHGNDRNGQARIKGTLEARVASLDDGTRLTVLMQLDVLGRLAALGATPMRRRADSIFNEFLTCVSSELSTSGSAA